MTGKFPQARPHPRHWPIFVTQMLTRDLFAVADLVVTSAEEVMFSSALIN